jgi:hypothetical protein
MVGQLLEHTQNSYKYDSQAKASYSHPANLVKVAHAQQAAWITVHQEYATIVANGTYGQL